VRDEEGRAEQSEKLRESLRVHGAGSLRACGRLQSGLNERSFNHRDAEAQLKA
jgi:hypothetical protein